ncbi:MAG: hypothetical protein DVB28_000143 [Verrucomicrobia bacterium]|nr:MAG: hypothetical protein DVB28_000143 [Verrucomicrobiota bacterium]
MNLRPGIAGFFLLSMTTAGEAVSFTGHAVPVGRGSLGGTLPPPGFYLRDCSVFYTADRLNLSNGERAPVDFKLSGYANLLRGLWVSEGKFLGGNYAIDASIVAQTTTITLNGVTRSGSGLADSYIQPVGVGWHGERWDAVFGYTLWVPTGESEPGGVRPGKGFWGHMVSAGATVYLDERKSWAASLVNRYETNQEERHSHITPGDQISMEWGLSKKVAARADVGFVGCYQKQVTKDAGPLASGAMDSEFSLGPELVVTWPVKRMAGTVRYIQVVEAKGRPQARALTWVISKRF